jgi:hypothetical protein
MTDASVSAVHLQALVSTPAVARVSGIQLQVLMPTSPPAAVVSGIEVQVLMAQPYVVTMIDETTPIQVLHTDNVWRSLQIKF